MQLTMRRLLAPDRDGNKRERDGCKRAQHTSRTTLKQQPPDEEEQFDTELPPPSSSSVSKVREPCLEPYFKPVDYVETLAKIHEKLETATGQEKASLYLEQSFVFRGLGETKLVRRSLRFACQHASTDHERLVYEAWHKYEKREEELEDGRASSCCDGSNLESPAPEQESEQEQEQERGQELEDGRASSCCDGSNLQSPALAPESELDRWLNLSFEYPPSFEDLPNRSPMENEEARQQKVNFLDLRYWPCRSDSEGEEQQQQQPDKCSTSSPSSCSVENDIVFHLHGEEVECNRQKIAALSLPFHAMLNGCYTEARKKAIDFSDNGISVTGMKAVDEFSKTRLLPLLPPPLLLELLQFASRFCCEALKDACDERIAVLIQDVHYAHIFFDYGLEESAQALVAACLQVFMQDLPGSLGDPQFVDLLASKDVRKRLMNVGQSSFAFYALLSHAALEEEMLSDLSLLLLRCLLEFSVTERQKAFAFHQLGCVLLARKQYTEARDMFQGAVQEGHTYSRAGLARLMCQRGHRSEAHKEITSIISAHKPEGWMYQERSLYCHGKEKLMDLKKATELDPTLTFPYKYRAAAFMDEQNLTAAMAEVNQILSFKVTPDCLEMRVYCCLALQDYEGAVRDVRALLTLDPSYMMYSGRVGAVQLLTLLSQPKESWTIGDCWVQLHDRWSAVDDIGSLAVVHQMLELDPRGGIIFFRQSLLLLRLNCPKAAMRSLRLAREYASSKSERLVYEGWILYDTGHREEALKKAEESICIQRSFEAFFLKAYALADTSLDPESSAKVVELLEEALKCPSDGLRKGQALNNLGSVYVDCLEYRLAADCYTSALKIRHTRAHQGLARVHFLEGNKESAHLEMTKLIEKAQNNASAYEKRSEYCDRDMTMADLKVVTELDPLRTYPYRFRAAVLMDSQKEKDAIAELSRAIAFKADLQLLHLRAAFHECIGDIKGAIRDCRAALSVDPNHFDTLQLHSRVHSREP